MTEPKIQFQPRWKEELVCSCELGSFVLGMPMGVVSVDFPTEDTWLQEAPSWAKPYWASIRNQLADWCESQNVPLYIGPYGHVFTSIKRSFRVRQEIYALDIPRIFNITESAHRIHNPFTPDKFATLGAALRLKTGARVLDLGSGSGEMLCTWARDHGIVGTGIDMSPLFTEQAKRRAIELCVAHQVEFIHDDAAGYVSEEKADVAACVGATWIGGGVAGTIELLARSLRAGGIILIGEPYWRQLPPTEEIAKGCLANSISDFLSLTELIASFGKLGYDVVEMVLANQDGWDRYEAAKWLTMRRWLEANPDDDLAEEVCSRLTTEPERHATYTREYLGWGVFALMPRLNLKKD